MSFHRVLPRPLALSNKELANRWAAPPDSVRSAKTMTSERAKSAYVENSRIAEPLPLDNASRRSTVELPERPVHNSLPQHEESNPAEGSHSDSAQDSAKNRAPSSIDAWQGDSPSQICLCQPDPKVPRPRNAFILYRQHHQASVVAQNPGLANPEISKVIGDHWRAAAPEIKEHWKLLAEEEKIRHQKQYPDYRYQPRRTGRNSSAAELSHNPSVFGDGQRCSKCGGKSISSSSVISTNSSISTQGSPPLPHQITRSDSQIAMPPPTVTSISAGRFARAPSSPSARDDSPQSYRFTRPQTAHALALASPRQTKRPAEVNEQSPISPVAKRRRMPTIPYSQSRVPHGPQTPFTLSKPGQRRPSLPRPDFLTGTLSSPTAMGQSAGPRTASLQMRSDSLRLPPLHTNAVGDNSHFRSDSSDAQHAKTLEAMIHSIPLLARIRVLGRVCGPLPLIPDLISSIGFQRRKGRGVVIAIDSADSLAIRQLTATLEAALKYETNLRIFCTPKPSEDEPATLQSYLRLVDQYHTLSGEVVEHVTPAPRPKTSLPLTSSPGDSPEKMEIEEGEVEEEQSPVSPKSFPKLRSSTHTNASKSINTKSKHSISPAPPSAMSITSDTHDNLTSVALVPGWHLTHTDSFAARVPITDAYSPMDHWQWHATLWRGTVGADVTVAVQASVPEEVTTSPPGTAGIAGGAGTAGGNDGSKHVGGNANGGENAGARSGSGGAAGTGMKVDKANGGVDIRLEDSRSIVVQGGEKGVSEVALRRVGFEMSEWVRGWGGGMRKVLDNFEGRGDCNYLELIDFVSWVVRTSLDRFVRNGLWTDSVNVCYRQFIEMVGTEQSPAFDFPCWFDYTPCILACDNVL
ncbi:uncharacterized protein KY384_004435 [Bacidia gigantensis]|uniref:uncharacterized protein n=1 Tax=Bacidia gigantensis TaxID=2732470 RepID=UPI001D040CDA|nr:uncharacterized protein KY384_004435 [Bacidia gigantensis]KAG8531078.1 hypothetical protein KY384_004435 [Bacidia gigantensis]